MATATARLPRWGHVSLHPCSVHELYLPELWGEQANAYRAQRRFDEAIDAWEQAIDVGYRSVPHPRADIAETLLEADRRPEADALFETLRQECTDDVWLYNAAGFAYSHAGDDDEALRWLDAGIELALRTDDPEGLLGQLMEFRERSLNALGRPLDDELARRVGQFVRPSGARGSITGDFGGSEPPPQRCGHCGWDPEEEKATRMPMKEVEALARALRSTQPLTPSPPSTRPEPVTRQKVGRNEPCPCGSGSKYKHCHGR
jgi:tetratricopeptide (TPR) repeat protein